MAKFVIMSSISITFKSLIVLFGVCGYAVLFAQTPGSYNAIALGGKSARGSIVDDTTLNPTSAITIEAWIKADSFKTGNLTNHIVSKHGNYGGYDLRLNANGGVNFRFGTSSGWKFIHSKSKLQKGRWYHVAGTFNGDSICVYINGELERVKKFTGRIGASYKLTLKIGEYSKPLINPLPGGNFDGMIDEVRIWGGAISQQQLKDWMCKKIKTYHPERKNLLAYYRFDENNGTIFYDLSGNGNHGTLAGNRVRSGAPLGDTAIYSLKGNFHFVASNGDTISVRTDSSFNKGVYFYHVDESPADTSVSKSTYLPAVHYFGHYLLDSGTYQFNLGIKYNTKNSFYLDQECYLDLLFKNKRTDYTWMRESQKRFYIKDSMSAKNIRAEEVQLCKYFNGRKVVIKNLDTIRCANEFVRLTAYGNDSFSFQWYKNGNSIKGETNEFTRINETGLYHVRVERNSRCSYASIPVNIKINSIPKVTLARQKPICEYQDTAIIKGGWPKGGSYLGFIVVKDSLVIPKLFNSGSYPIYYTFTDSNGCTNLDTQIFHIQEKPQAVFRRKPELCDSRDTFNLLQIAKPNGGRVEGKAIFNNMFYFDSLAQKKGKYTFQYFYADSVGCRDTAYGELTINESTNLQIKSIDDTCINVGNLKLKSNVSAANFYGNGVKNGFLNTKSLGIGSHRVFASYTNLYGCESIDTITISIHPIDTVKFFGIDSVCRNSDSIVLKTARPVGGQYSGESIKSNVFYPDAIDTAQKSWFNYIYTNQFGCADTAKSYVALMDTQGLKVSAKTTFCDNEKLLNLEFVEPKGGIYSVNDSIIKLLDFSLLGIRNIPLLYKYQNAKCHSKTLFNITVNESPKAYFECDSLVYLGDVLNVINKTKSVNTANYTWTFSGAQLFTDTNKNPMFKPDSLGLINMKLAVVDSLNGCIDTFVKSNAFRVILNTSLKNMFGKGVNIYPNPASNYLIVNQNGKELVDYNLFSINGDLLQNGRLSKNGTIDIHSLDDGVYFIVLTFNSLKSKVFQFVKYAN